MSSKIALSTVVLCLLLACVAEARHAYRAHRTDEPTEVVSVAGRHPHPSVLRSSPHQQGRIFPGAVAIKKLVLLKFKKIIPISLILLKAGDGNEAELVPVYPTSDIPANVQFIPTPNGISGHKDVQAIAIPTELHQQLELNGLANLENIEALLNQAQEEESTGESSVTIVQQLPEGDEPLNLKEDDDQQLLEGVSVDTPAPAPIKTTNVSGVRRLSSEDIGKTGLRTSPHHTQVEEIPLYLYSTKDTPQTVYTGRKPNPGGRYIALRRQHA